MKNKIKIYLFIILNSFFVVVVLWSLMIYTSQMSNKLPWYEPDGIIFMAIPLLSCPVFIVLGIIEFILSEFININKILKFLPFMCSLGMGLPVLIERDSLIGIGTITGLITVISTIFFTTINVKELLKGSN